MQVVTTQPSTSESSLPGIHQIKTQVPVKVTTMHLGTSPLWNGGVLYDDSAQDAIQRGRYIKPNQNFLQSDVFILE